jgi:MFS family permease
MTHHRADCICQGCFLLLFGRLADLYGRKKVFILGSLWLAVFSLGLGFANGIIVFSPLLPSCLGSYVADEITIDVLRGFQGIGAAATIPSAVPSFSLNLTQQIFTFPANADRYFGPRVSSVSYAINSVLNILRRRPYWRSYWHDSRRCPHSRIKVCET